MPAGRPTDYSPEILEAAQKYLSSCKDEEEQQVVGLSAKGTELYRNKLKVNLPSVEGLAATLKVHRDTLYEWAKHYPEFSDTLEDIKAEQKKRLMDKGLSGDYNPTIAKLILSANHDMREKTDVTTGGESLNPSEEDKSLANKALNQLKPKPKPNGSSAKNSKQRDA